MKVYHPIYWYWQTDDGSRTYSSNAKGYVSADDPDLLEWMADGTRPQRWPRDENGDESDAEMNAVLAGFGQKLPTTKSTSAKTGS